MMVNTKNTVKILKNIFKRELAWVWVFGFVLSLVAAALSAGNKLPLGKGDFVFLSLVALLIALYRPRWIFFLFVGSISLENVILTGNYIPFQLRPYQFLAGILILAMIILFISKRIGFKFLKPNWIDWLILTLVPLSFLALIGASNKSISLKNNLILISFIALYFLVRNFLRNCEDLAKTSAFLMISFLTTILFGFYQVFSDKLGAKSFEIMFGRPNSTFAEPDWLGIYLVFALAVFLALIFYFLRSKRMLLISRQYIFLFLDVFIFFDITLLILTLSRSAWIGAAVVITFYFLALAPSRKTGAVSKYVGGWKGFLRESAIIFSIIIASLLAVHFGKLSKFDIFDRARSTATSEQKITIACENSADIPDSIEDIGELPKYNCRHINLEEINFYKLRGKIVAETFRKDPNVRTRSEIYRESWNILKKSPLLGIGYGTITEKIGVDQRVAGLNESNVFLQIWAGSGILGLMAFIAVFGYLFIYAFRRISPICPMNRFFGCPVVKDDFEKAMSVFTVLGITSLIVPNLFNAGLFMGIFWFGLAIIVSTRNIRSDSF